MPQRRRVTVNPNASTVQKFLGKDHFGLHEQRASGCGARLPCRRGDLRYSMSWEACYIERQEVLRSLAHPTECALFWDAASPHYCLTTSGVTEATGAAPPMRYRRCAGMLGQSCIGPSPTRKPR